MAALIALADLQKLDSHFDGSSQSVCALLSAGMELVVETRALKAKDSMFPAFCLESLKECLDQCSPGAP